MTTFTTKEKTNGEMACRNLSKLAQRFYDGTDPLKVYEHADGTYSVTGAISLDHVSFIDMQRDFEECQRDIYQDYWENEMDEDERADFIAKCDAEGYGPEDVDEDDGFEVEVDYEMLYVELMVDHD